MHFSDGPFANFMLHLVEFTYFMDYLDQKSIVSISRSWLWFFRSPYNSSLVQQRTLPSIDRQSMIMITRSIRDQTIGIALLFLKYKIKCNSLFVSLWKRFFFCNTTLSRASANDDDGVDNIMLRYCCCYIPMSRALCGCRELCNKIIQFPFLSSLPAACRPLFNHLQYTFLQYKIISQNTHLILYSLLFMHIPRNK